MKLLLFVMLCVILGGCTIPVVGNSPEEIQHRKQLEQQQHTDQPL